MSRPNLVVIVVGAAGLAVAAATAAENAVAPRGETAARSSSSSSLDKPDFARLPRPPRDAFRCLVVFGLYTHVLRIDEALADWRYQGKHRAAIAWANCPPNAVESFPGTYEEMFGYHVVILSDVNNKAIGEKRVEMLRDYVEQGGRLLVGGGPYALGNGEFGGTRFLDLLPVTLSGPFDLKWAGKGRSWELTPAVGMAAHRALAGVSFAQKPRVYWQHAVAPKAGAEVLLRAGGQPSLVLGRFGKGKVAVWTPSPTGNPQPGETAWWDSDAWPALLRNSIDSLVE